MKGKELLKPKTGEIYFIKADDLDEFPAGLYCKWKLTQSIKKHYKLGTLIQGIKLLLVLLLSLRI